MSTDVSKDQLALIRIDGMHCHKCEKAIAKALEALPGVHEVEVDFNACLASVLFDRSQVTVPQLMETVTEAGYQATGVSEQEKV